MPSARPPAVGPRETEPSGFGLRGPPASRGGLQRYQVKDATRSMPEASEPSSEVMNIIHDFRKADPAAKPPARKRPTAKPPTRFSQVRLFNASKEVTTRHGVLKDHEDMVVLSETLVKGAKTTQQAIGGFPVSTPTAIALQVPPPDEEDDAIEIVENCVIEEHIQEVYIFHDIPKNKTSDPVVIKKDKSGNLKIELMHQGGGISPSKLFLDFCQMPAEFWKDYQKISEEVCKGNKIPKRGKGVRKNWSKPKDNPAYEGFWESGTEWRYIANTPAGIAAVNTLRPLLAKLTSHTLSWMILILGGLFPPKTMAIASVVPSNVLIKTFFNSSKKAASL